MIRNNGTSRWPTVPVTIAPSRRATDRQIAGRHIGTPVLAWQAENRASFILDKLEEGYDNDQLHDQLGFTLADIQKARQTRAIADMARSIDLPFAPRSLRARTNHVEYLLRLAARSRLPARTSAGLRWEVPGNVQGIPATAEGRELQS